MPEYLAPGVYVEEVDTGSKPIEGVSTSTSGMVGVTERGPVDVPILITSMGEYVRAFGEKLNSVDFSNGKSDPHCFLPHAVQGFFDNGGKRVYITRVPDKDNAKKASSSMYDRGKENGADTILLRAAAELTGTAANLPKLVVLTGSNIADGDYLRIGDGSQSEYRQVAVGGVENDIPVIALNLPLSRSHASGASVLVDEYSRALVASSGTSKLVGAISAGAQAILISGTNSDISTKIVATSLIEIKSGNKVEYRFVTKKANIVPDGASNSQCTLTLDSPLQMAYPNNADICVLDVSATTHIATITTPPALSTSVSAGESILFVSSSAGLTSTAGTIVIVDSTSSSNKEARLLGAMSLLKVMEAFSDDYLVGSVVEKVSIAAPSWSISSVNSAKTVITLTAAADLAAGQTIQVGTGSGKETVDVLSSDIVAKTITLAAAMTGTHAAAEPVVVASKVTTADVNEGVTYAPVDNRTGISEGDVIWLSDSSGGEYLTVTDLPGRTSNPVAPDAGNIAFSPATSRVYAKGSKIDKVNAPVVQSSPVATRVVVESAYGQSQLIVANGAAFAANDILRVTLPSGVVAYHVLSANPQAISPDGVTLTEALLQNHPFGSIVKERGPMFQVEALDAGAWGNRLRISVQDEETGLVAQTTLTQFGPATRIRLASFAGVEPGSILEVLDPSTEETVGGFLKVAAIDRSTGDITLGGSGLDTYHLNAIALLPSGKNLLIRSREFALTVRLLRQPDPAMPSRNNTVIDQETFRYLSMDYRHSRYIHKVIGDTQGALRQSDRRPEGESMYIRVHDLAQDKTGSAKITALESVRLGPETLTDILPDGRELSARHALYHGGDSITSMTDDLYIGEDSTIPEERTGLQALRNIEEISIVAIPGRTSVLIQNAVINHCELLRYRFAVLDGPQPPKDTLTDVQTQRQQFDTKYAALYYPWMIIPDPYPKNLANIADYSIPPSGHMLGVYARTDIERGVHKAPANEVVKGITGLQRLLNKEQQDILNPYPVNINVIRDFRHNNRGIRVYGGRCITSDSDWKYVNVRRLLIFIEASIDRGLQWVVFEPNAEPLWARVRRSVSNFLTLCWRNGALEGTKPEEAYFVKCDRTTMTQTDIDSGRLICLIGVAPVKPAEFVIIRIGLWTAHAED